MTLKRIIGTFLGGIVLVAIAAGGIFYWKNLRGAYIPFVDSSSKQGTLTNTTGKNLVLPPEFSISIFAEGLKNPRTLVKDPTGTLLTSIPAEGRVVALPDDNKDGKSDRTITIAEGLNNPHGLAFHCTASSCTLFIAETNKVAAYDYDAQSKKISNGRKILDLPASGGHSTRSLLIFPYKNETKLLISVGSSCNVCREEDPRRAAVLISDLDGKNSKVFARGLRNAVFLARHPITGNVWVTEMGRDLLGDNIPPDEINILKEDGNYGWPNCYGKNDHDGAFDKNVYIRNPCMDPFETSSYIDIPAHSAPLGLAFIPEKGWPIEYQHDLLVAYHGSWNRTEPTGYKIVRYTLDRDGTIMANHAGEDLISGWLSKDGVSGRPADILAEENGVLYISDDRAGMIYRAVYGGVPVAGKENLIRVLSPLPDSLVKSPLVITGEARGYWFFEASFPIRLIDANGKEIIQSFAEAKSEWMTTDFVPFERHLTFPTPETSTGTLILSKDNPSGLPENDDEVRIPIRFK
jgi:glucose/arabinose dehydrogenase